jgi:hypothetical protein
LDTTHIYAEVDLEMKPKRSRDVPGLVPAKRKPRSPDTLSFLKSL